MKHVQLISILFLSLTSFAQQTTNSQVRLEVEEFSKRTTNTADAFFRLRLYNNLGITISFNKEDLETSVPRGNNSIGFILYEIHECRASDTIDHTAYVRANVDRFSFRDSSRIYLQPTQSFMINDVLDIMGRGMFIDEDKEGIFRVRFSMRKESFQPALKEDIFTDWVFVTVE